MTNTLGSFISWKQHCNDLSLDQWPQIRIMTHPHIYVQHLCLVWTLTFLFIQVNDRHQNGTNWYTYEKTLRKFYHGQTDECDSIIHRLPSKLMHKSLCVFGARLYNFYKKIHSLVSENMFGQKKNIMTSDGWTWCFNVPLFPLDLNLQWVIINLPVLVKMEE